MSDAPVMKRMCRGCPFNEEDEASHMAYNLGCLPSRFEIASDCRDNGTAWKCHSALAVCAGYAEQFPDRIALPLELVPGVNCDEGLTPGN